MLLVVQLAAGLNWRIIITSTFLLVTAENVSVSICTHMCSIFEKTKQKPLLSFPLCEILLSYLLCCILLMDCHQLLCSHGYQTMYSNDCTHSTRTLYQPASTCSRYRCEHVSTAPQSLEHYCRVTKIILTISLHCSQTK